MSRPTQLLYLHKSLYHYPEHPNPTNLSSAGTYTGSGVAEAEEGRLLRRKLRWATLGNDYNWSEKTYAPESETRPLPDEIRHLAVVVVALLRLSDMMGGEGEFEPDAAIVNYYPPNAHLAPHVDR